MSELDVGHWARGLEVTASIHRSWVGREPEIAALGAPDRSLARLLERVPALLEAVELSPDDRRRATPVLGELEDLAADLGAGPLPHTLVHGDLHPGNVMVSGDEVRVFDWSDGALSHPLFDLPTYVSWANDEPARETLVDAYLACWADVASPAVLSGLATKAAPLANVHQAISYLGILEALEEDDRWWFADEPRRWLLRAVELVGTMRS